jgi:hypothetical protein
MAVGTRKSNAVTHPGCIVLESQQTRQTKKQIEADEASAELEASVAQQAADTQHRASIAHIADVEDPVMEEEESVRMYTNRPDLRPQAASGRSANAKRPNKRSNPG